MGYSWWYTVHFYYHPLIKKRKHMSHPNPVFAPKIQGCLSRIATNSSHWKRGRRNVVRSNLTDRYKSISLYDRYHISFYRYVYFNITSILPDFSRMVKPPSWREQYHDISPSTAHMYSLRFINLCDMKYLFLQKKLLTCKPLWCIFRRSILSFLTLCPFSLI